MSDRRRLAAGTTFGHDRIVSELGSGGMGDVYVTEDASLGRTVALKVLPHDVAASADRRERFEREVRAVAAVYAIAFRTAPPAPADVESPRIVIVPFENLGNAEDE